MDFNPKLVIFDVAGTTVRDTGHIPTAFRTAFAAHGLHVTDEQVEGVRGAAKRAAVQQLVPDSPRRAQIADEIYQTFREELAHAYERGGIHPVDGAERVFRELRAKGIRVALNTGLDRDIMVLLLNALGWSIGVVDAVVCGDDVQHGRPAPDLIFRAMALTGIASPDDVAIVGDTALDLQAGRRAGVRWTIGVCSGAHDRAMLAREKPTYLLESVDAWPGAWRD